MKSTNVEIRDGKLHISGYVNAVERDSKVINTKRGKCVEQIAAGAFAASLADGHEVRMKFNHKRDIGSTADGVLTLKENSIGLYAEAETDDEELMTLAGKGELRGWSFGFVAKDDELEQRDGKEPRRRVKALDLQEVSILSVTPAYNGTSVEIRSYEEYTEEENTEERTEDTTDHKADAQALKNTIAQLKLKGYILEKRAEQRELEERYNPYHNPMNGQFTTAGGGAGGVHFVPKGRKGRGYNMEKPAYIDDNDELDKFYKDEAKRRDWVKKSYVQRVLENEDLALYYNKKNIRDGIYDPNSSFFDATAEKSNYNVGRLRGHKFGKSTGKQKTKITGQMSLFG